MSQSVSESVSRSVSRSVSQSALETLRIEATKDLIENLGMAHPQAAAPLLQLRALASLLAANVRLLPAMPSLDVAITEQATIQVFEITCHALGRPYWKGWSNLSVMVCK